MKINEITRMAQLAGIDESAKYEVTLTEATRLMLEESSEFFFTGKSKTDGSDKIWKFGDMSYEEAEMMANKFGYDVKTKVGAGGQADERGSNFADYSGDERRVHDLGRAGRGTVGKKFS